MFCTTTTLLHFCENGEKDTRRYINVKKSLALLAITINNILKTCSFQFYICNSGTLVNLCNAKRNHAEFNCTAGPHTARESIQYT